MLGIAIAASATFVAEAGQIISKKEVSSQRETLAEMAFINMLFATGILILIVFLVPNESFVGNLFGGFRFEAASLPFFIARYFFELLVIYLVVTGFAKATRATFSFLRLATIPLLLVADIILGYEFTGLEIIGILVVILTTSSLFFTRTLKKEGMWYVLAGSIGAVITISLYKYNITNHNSVAGEQISMLGVLLFTLFFVCLYQTRKNPMRHLARPRAILQSALGGCSSVLASLAISLAPASVIMTVKRVSGIFWAILSGRTFFHEQHTAAKLAGLGILSLGILMLAGLS